MNFEQLQRGIDLYNKGYFFEAHDTLEDLWMETSGSDKLFLQGLIQVSVGFYHYFNRNYKGAMSQFSKGLTKLSKYCPGYRGVELSEFIQHVTRWQNLAIQRLTGDRTETDEMSVPNIYYLTEI